MSHCSHIVDWGRTHFRRFYDLYKIILKDDLYRVKLGKAAREDLRWWAIFSETFDSIRKIDYPEFELFVYIQGERMARRLLRQQVRAHK